MLPFPGASGWQLIDWQSHYLGEFLIKGRSLPHRRGEVDPPQEEWAGCPFTGHKDGFQIATEPGRQRMQAIWELVKTIYLVGATDAWLVCDRV